MDCVITFRIDESLLRKIDWEVERSAGKFLNRSHFVRSSVIRMIRKELMKDE